MTTWHKGPPPSIGWWPASVGRNPQAIRWWDGQHWSFSVNQRSSAEVAGKMAQIKNEAAGIEWAQRWWEEKK